MTKYIKQIGVNVFQRLIDLAEEANEIIYNNIIGTVNKIFENIIQTIRYKIPNNFDRIIFKGNLTSQDEIDKLTNSIKGIR